MSIKPYSIQIAGSDSAYDCMPGENLLRTALRAGIGFPYECNTGGCGSCKFELLKGEVDDRWPEAPGIRAKERERGRRLACQCIPLSDCEIRVRVDDSFAPTVSPGRVQATFAGSVHVSDEIREFEFKTTEPACFVPGQYALIRLPNMDEVRAYSMSNQPNEEGVWRFMIRNVPAGKVSGRFFDNLAQGASVEIDGPYGLAYLRPGTPREIVCIAGGSGLAPVVSIVNGAKADPTLAEKNIWMFYGGRGPKDIPLFEAFIHPQPNIYFHSAISVPALAEGTDWAGEVCFVHELLPRRLDQPLDGFEYYLAGPPSMIEAVVRLLVEHRVPAEQIHYDRFF